MHRAILHFKTKLKIQGDAFLQDKCNLTIVTDEVKINLKLIILLGNSQVNL
jgi:hypothetical protein